MASKSYFVLDMLRPLIIIIMHNSRRHQMETFFRVTGPLCGEFTDHR